MTPLTNVALPPEAIVLDASVCVSIISKEQACHVAEARINKGLLLGAQFYAPGVLLSETLFVLCGKLQLGNLSQTDHDIAINHFEAFLGIIQPAPMLEVAYMRRAEAIRGSYTCRRSADGIYIALAEALTALGRPTALLTFDVDMQKQAARYAPTVNCELLT